MKLPALSSVLSLLFVFFYFDSASQCDLDSLHKHKRKINGEALRGTFSTWNSPLVDSLEVTALLTYRPYTTFPLQRLSYSYEEGKGCSFFYYADELLCLSLIELKKHFWLCEGKIEYCTNLHIEQVNCDDIEIDLARKFILQSDSLVQEFYKYALPDTW
jgi:hypothetical protein